MSYVRVNDSSDSEDDVANSSAPNAPSAPATPSAHTRRAGSAAAASLASLTRAIGSTAHEYSPVDGHAEEEEEQEDGAANRGNTGHDRSEAQTESESENDIEIHIRFGEGQDLSLRVPRTDTVAQLKEKVKEAKPSISDKYLRLIHAGKILSDNKTLIESLPKSLFTHVEVPHHQSRLSSSVEAVEAAASNILAGISSRTSGEKSAIRTHTSLGSILPTHIGYSSSYSPSENTTSTNTTTTSTTSHPLTAEDSNHVSIAIPAESGPDASRANNNRHNNTHSSTITIPVQTGPIYFLCSLSDIPPTQPSSEAKKGKAVVADNVSNTRRTGSSRTSRSRRLPTAHVPSQSTSVAAAMAGASSPLMLPGRSHRSRSSSSGAEGGVSQSNGTPEVQEEDDTEDGEEDEELSPNMEAQPTGFDRLREAGFSEDEIRSIRRQFHASRGTVTSTVGENGIAVGLDQDEDASAMARRIEEEWIDQHGAETLPEGLEGSYGEMVWGLMLGFFLGLITLFWFKEATFSRRQQMGIIAGLMVNVGFGVLHLYY